MSVKLWERLEVAEKLIKDLQRRVLGLEKQAGTYQAKVVRPDGSVADKTVARRTN